MTIYNIFRYKHINMSSYLDNKTLFNEPRVIQHNSHQIMTNVVKPQKVKYINIDTKYCDEYNNNRLDPSCNDYNLAKFTVTIPERVNDVKSIEITDAEIPMTYFNISSALGNNYFKISTDISDGIYVSNMIVLDDGEYTASSLATAIQTELNGVTWAVGYLGYALRFAITNNFSAFSIDPDTYDPSGNWTGRYIDVHFAVSRDGSFDKYNFKNKLGWLLGYRNTDYTIIRDVGDPAESIVNLTGPKYLYLVVDDFTRTGQNSFVTPLHSSFINKNVIAKLLVNKSDYPFGTLMTMHSNNGYLVSDIRSYCGSVDMQKLNVQLLDEAGNVVNLNGVDFSFTMRIVYE
jgi:hypothetical protein